MPLYEYACLDCEERFEELRPAGRADAAVPCTSCGGNRVKRLLSVFATISRGGASTSDAGAYAAPRAGGGCACGGNCSCNN